MALHKENRQPKTVMKHLLALRKFGSFLVLHNDEASSIKVQTRTAGKTVMILDEIMRTHKGPVKARQAELKSKICGNYKCKLSCQKLVMAGDVIC